MHSTPLRELLLKYLQYQQSQHIANVQQSQHVVQQTQHIDNGFLSEIPKSIAIRMMDNDSYNGNYKKNPFNFQHFKLT